MGSVAFLLPRERRPGAGAPYALCRSAIFSCCQIITTAWHKVDSSSLSDSCSVSSDAAVFFGAGGELSYWLPQSEFMNFKNAQLVVDFSFILFRLFEDFAKKNYTFSFKIFILQPLELCRSGWPQHLPLFPSPVLFLFSGNQVIKKN
jgi:hypothetical protein